MRSLLSMIHSRNKTGFTLIEMLLAVAIIGIVLGPLYILQGTVFDRVVRMAESVDRMLIAYDFFVEVKDDDEHVVKKAITDPLTDIVYEKKEPQKSSVLAKEFNHLFIKKISWSWKYKDTSYNDELIDISFIPPEQKESADASAVAQKAMAGQEQKPEGAAQKKPQPVGEADKKKGDDKKVEEDKKDEKKI
jgi:prepilin-type N-terminal cleavage/methylation domain-containing protein